MLIQKPRLAWVSRLESAVVASADTSPVHVTLLAVDNEHSWTFLSTSDNPSFDILKRIPIPAPPLPSKPSRHTHTSFADASYTSYYLAPPLHTSLYPSYVIDRSAKCGPFPFVPGSSESPYVPDLEDEDPLCTGTISPCTEPLRAPAWSAVVCAPSSTDPTSLSTTQIFQLYTVRSPRSTYGAQEDRTALMGDIVRSFHELAALSRVRWKLHADPALPFHLAALEVMQAALSGGAVNP